eukprot:9248197-Pyramimonas_sp.AAC.1
MATFFQRAKNEEVPCATAVGEHRAFVGTLASTFTTVKLTWMHHESSIHRTFLNSKMHVAQWPASKEKTTTDHTTRQGRVKGMVTSGWMSSLKA